MLVSPLSRDDWIDKDTKCLIQGIEKDDDKVSPLRLRKYAHAPLGYGF